MEQKAEWNCAETSVGEEQCVTWVGMIETLL